MSQGIPYLPDDPYKVLTDDSKRAIEALGSVGLNPLQVDQLHPSRSFAAPAPIPPAPPATVPEQPEIAPVTEGSTDLNDRIATGEGFKSWLLSGGGLTPPAGPGNELMPEGENYLTQGGPEGRNIFQDTFVDTPQRFAAAARDEANAEASLGDARAQVIKGMQDSQQAQLAAIEQRRKEREAGELQRQQQLDAATQRYSDDLADTGKFWRNPGSIFAAMGAFMMGLSGKNDTYKVLNDAVMADWNQRREIANQHLGELKSNLASYRQITGDATRGDQIALSESYRVAAMELDRIASQFQGPIAKARAEKAIEGLMQQSNMIRMNAYRQGVYTPPQIVKPGMTKAYAAGGKAYPGVGYTPFGAPGPATSTPTPGPSASIPVGKLDAAIGTLGGKPKTFDMPPELAKSLDSRAPGLSGVSPAIKAGLWRDARMEAGTAGMRDPNVVAQKALGIYKVAEEQANKIWENAAAKSDWGDVRGWKQLQTDVARLEGAARLAGTTPDEFLGDLRSWTPEFAARINELRAKYSSQDTPAARQAVAHLEAAERFHQDMSNKMEDYFKTHIGGNQSNQELSMIRNVISSTANFAKMKHFVEMGGRNAQASMDQFIGTGNDLASAIARNRFGNSNPRVDSRGSK